MVCGGEWSRGVWRLKGGVTALELCGGGWGGGGVEGYGGGKVG